ncbi:MAG: hypothetical protein Ct9H300mP25_16570 [Acidobacteriota bacterium]|nr:MAG: hypothetical protein Ct9H300mP25_16570 [Acidobacteriota bacterium]
MIQRFFHAWERRLVAVTTDRVVRPFEWGLDWIDDVEPLTASGRSTTRMGIPYRSELRRLLRD